MSIYIIADLHLSFFPGADKPMDVFGGRWLGHTDRLKENWLKTVGPEDTVIIPGDISWALKIEEARYDLDWIDALPGKKVLIKGNHDLWWTGITRLNRMYEGMRFLQNDSYQADGCFICGSRGWTTPDDDDFSQADEKIYRRELLRLESSLKDAVSRREDPDMPIIGVMHYPPVCKVQSFTGFQQLFEDYGVKDVYYGHIHGEDGFRSCVQGEVHGINYHLISLDYLNCQPLRIR